MSIQNFIPTIWSARLLNHLDKSHVYLNLLNRDYEGEIKNFGDIVKINQVGDVSIKDYTKGTDIDAPEDITGEQQELKIDQAKYFNFAVDDVDNAQTNPKLMDKAMQRAAYAITMLLTPLRQTCWRSMSMPIMRLGPMMRRSCRPKRMPMII